MSTCFECGDRVTTDGCECEPDRAYCSEHLGACYWCGPALRESMAEELGGLELGAVGF